MRDQRRQTSVRRPLRDRHRGGLTTWDRIMDMRTDIMHHAIKAARAGLKNGESPFGAAIATLDGRLIVASHNTVRSRTDATAHAEINTIREACRLLGTIDLSGHVMATTCEPCPMCASAIHWANLDAVSYGACIADADAAGFRELAIACETVFAAGGGRIRIEANVLTEDCRALFDEWRRGPNAMPY